MLLNQVSQLSSKAKSRIFDSILEHVSSIPAITDIIEHQYKLHTKYRFLSNEIIGSIMKFFDIRVIVNTLRLINKLWHQNSQTSMVWKNSLLTIEESEVYHINFKSVIGLQRLHVLDGKYRPIGQTIDFQNWVKNSRVLASSLQFLEISIWHRLEQSKISKAISKFSNLIELKLYGFQNKNAIELALTNKPHLETLAIELSGDLTPNQINSMKSSLTNIRVLNIARQAIVKKEAAKNQVECFLISCPQLQTLDLSTQDVEICSNYKGPFLSLQHLSCNVSCILSTNIGLVFPKLISISLFSAQRLFDGFNSSIWSHMNCLESIKLNITDPSEAKQIINSIVRCFLPI